MTDSECEACAAPIREGTKKCPECGNYPAKELRNKGVVVVLAGGFGSIFHLWAGMLISIVGAFLVLTGIVGQVAGTTPADDHDVSPNKKRS
jgi:RNA polymerase subunit RPABC4/transcription elongation factor Spt4